MKRSPPRIASVTLVAVLAILGIFLLYDGQRDLGHFLIGGAVVGSAIFQIVFRRADTPRHRG